MRADARHNRSRLLAVAREAVSDHGANVSLRDVARRANVGLGTLYRHFPSREAIFDALLQESLDDLTRAAVRLAASPFPDEALVDWIRQGVAFVNRFSGVVDLMAAALSDPESALHASCTAVRSAGAGLLLRAQADGMARGDLTGIDLFALIGALGWVGDQPSFTPRADILFDMVTRAIFYDRRGRPAPD